MDNALSVLRTNPYVSSSVSLFLVLYAGLAAPALPSRFAGLFEHSVFKLLILALVVILLQGKNVTMGLLVAVGFVVSLGTLSRYRVFTMAGEFAGLVKKPAPKPKKKCKPKKPAHVDRNPDPAFAPDGQLPQSPSDKPEWSLGPSPSPNKLSLRGFEYGAHDEPNHLPGGHGDMDKNNGLQVAAPLHPDKKFSSGQDPIGYKGRDLATF
jgi:hypothetical protein